MSRGPRGPAAPPTGGTDKLKEVYEATHPAAHLERTPGTTAAELGQGDERAAYLAELVAKDDDELAAEASAEDDSEPLSL